MKDTDETSSENPLYEVGHDKPPRANRFTPGKSGNPRGRPKGKTRNIHYEAVLGQKVTIKEAGSVKKVTAAEALLLQLTKRGLEGDTAAARATLRTLEEARAQGYTPCLETLSIIRQIVSPGSINGAIETLRIGKLVNGYSQDNARILLAPWIVEAALLRMDTSELTVEQRNIIVAATFTPEKIRWP